MLKNNHNGVIRHAIFLILAYFEIEKPFISFRHWTCCLNRYKSKSFQRKKLKKWMSFEKAASIF